MKRLAFGLLLALASFFGLPSLTPVYAHEMGMATLEITETSTGAGQLLFKRTRSADGRLAPIEFTLLPTCKVRPLATMNEHDREVIQTASFQCAAGQALQGVQAKGFVRLAPDLVVQINRQGLTRHTVLTPQQPDFQLDLPASATALMQHYFVLGFEHMALGLDHVLFVAGLFLLWAARQQSLRVLVGLITGFTVGHSLTLALLSLGWLSLPVRAIEAWIALSVLYLATKVVRAQKGQAFTPADYALVVGFGVLHGAGFSAAMLDRGFPQEFLVSTLLAFNLGIELAQVVAVMTLLLARSILQKNLGTSTVKWSHQFSLMLIGGMALLWTTQRVMAYV